jgi:hypothetical protein
MCANAGEVRPLRRKDQRRRRDRSDADHRLTRPRWVALHCAAAALDCSPGQGIEKDLGKPTAEVRDDAEKKDGFSAASALNNFLGLFFLLVAVAPDHGLRWILRILGIDLGQLTKKEP